MPSQDYVLQDNKRWYDTILSDRNFRLSLLGFKCILVGLMDMIDGMQFWTPIVFYRHKTVLVSPWLCCIDKWHAESLEGCPGLNIFKWVVAGGTFPFPKDEVEQQQLVYFKNKVITITDTAWRPPQCIDIVPKKMMVWQKELILFLHCRVWNLCMFFF
jgi:hypothetical protein